MTPWLPLGGAMTVFVSLLGCQSSPTTNYTAETIGFTRAPQFGGTDQLWIMNGDGSGQSQLSVDGDGNRSLTWSPDGNSIAFESVRDDNPEIYTARMFSTGPGTYSAHDIQRRTANPADDSSPAWSPDCALLAFSSNRATPHFYNIYQLDLNTNNVTPITTGPYVDRSPAWSPDGSKIAFTRRSSDGSREIYMHVMNSGHDVRLTNNNVNDSDPSWSPSGRIIFARYSEDGTRAALFEMDPVDADGDGNGDHLVSMSTPDTNQFDQKPEYFGTGRAIVFRRSQEAGGEGPGDVWRFLVQDGTIMEPLLNLTRTDPQHEDGARWRPNGACVRKENVATRSPSGSSPY